MEEKEKGKNKSWWRKFERKGGKMSKVFDGCVGIVANFIYFILLNTLYDNFSFVKVEDFRNILVVLNISIMVNIALNVLLIVIRTNWYKSLMTVANNAFGFIGLLLMLIVFPFDFTESWNFLDTFLKIAFVIGLFGVVIGTIFESARFVKYAIQGK